MRWLDWILFWLRLRRPDPPIVPDDPPPQGDEAAKCIEFQNAERKKRGLEPLVGDDCLAGQAQTHAEWMRVNRRMTHDGFSGRLRACGRGAGGENVAAGYSSGSSVVSGWMGSSGHRANILKAGYKAIGVGFDGGYWCAIYGY